MTHTLLRTTALAAMLAAGAALSPALAQTKGAAPGASAAPGGGATGSVAGGSPGDGTRPQAGAATKGTPLAGQTAPASPGASTGMAMTNEQIRSKLEGQGYANVESMTRDGNDFRVRAMQNGKPMDLRVDAYTGTVRSSTAAR